MLGVTGVHVICELQLLCVHAITELTGQIQVVVPHKSAFIMGVDEATKDVLKKIFHKPSLSEFRLPILPAVITIMSKVTPQGITHIQQTLHTLCAFKYMHSCQVGIGFPSLRTNMFLT